MDNVPTTVFATRFEAIKRHFNIRNTDLARYGEVSDAAIGKIMKGKTEAPEVGLLVNLVKKLNLNPSWILIGEGDMILADGSLPNSREEYYKEKLKNSYRTIADLTEFVGKSKGVSRKSRIASSPSPVMPSTNLFGMNAAEG